MYTSIHMQREWRHAYWPQAMQANSHATFVWVSMAQKIIISHCFVFVFLFCKTLTCQPPPFILNYSIYTPLQEHEGVLWPFVKEAIGQRL